LTDAMGVDSLPLRRAKGAWVVRGGRCVVGGNGTRRLAVGLVPRRGTGAATTNSTPLAAMLHTRARAHIKVVEDTRKCIINQLANTNPPGRARARTVLLRQATVYAVSSRKDLIKPNGNPKGAETRGCAVGGQSVTGKFDFFSQKGSVKQGQGRLLPAMTGKQGPRRGPQRQCLNGWPCQNRGGRKQQFLPAALINRKKCTGRMWWLEYVYRSTWTPGHALRSAGRGPKQYKATARELRIRRH
jgi:hypothetical protein